MSEKPIFAPKQAMPLDALFDQLREQTDVDALNEALQNQNNSPVPLPPSVAKFLYGMACQGEGEQVLEWLCDITIRRLESGVSKSIEEEALTMARVKERNLIMMQIVKAVLDGQRLADTEEKEKGN